MQFTFVSTLPEKDSGRLLMDIPVKITEEGKWSNKAKVTVNDTCYLCNIYKKVDGFCSIHLIRALKRDVGLGKTVELTLELIEETKLDIPDIHSKVLNWEQNEGKELMHEIGIKNDYSIIDFGCGFGHYTLPCALAMNNTGKVYAIDLKTAELKWIRKKSEMFSVSNIETVKTKGSLSMDFPEKSVDFVLLFDIIHSGIKQESNKAAIPIRFPLYKEAYRVLKKGGILSILDFESQMKAVPDKNGIHKKSTLKDLVEEMPEYGFELYKTVGNGIHFDWYHNYSKMKKGFKFEELEKGTVYNFIKKQRKKTHQTV